MNPTRQPLPPLLGVVWRMMLGGTVLDLLLIAEAVLSGNTPLGYPGGGGYVAEGTLPLLIGGIVLLGVPAIGDPDLRAALQSGTAAGLAGAGVLVAHMVLENVGSRPGEKTAVTLAFMAGGFLIWGAAGLRAAAATRRLRCGSVAGCWSSLISVLAAVTFGLILMTANIPPPAYVATWPEFQQSGWANAHAFAIANCFDAISSHLIAGPVIGTAMGFLGGALARFAARRRETRPTQ